MDDLEARILAAEKRAMRLRTNPAPTVPMYGLGASTPPPPPPGGNPTRNISGSSGTYSDDNTSVALTGSGSDRDILGNGIFYKWTAPSNGTVTVRTDSVDISQPPDIEDTVLYILPNNTTTTPYSDAIAFNDDDHGPTGYIGSAYYSLVTFTAVAGTTYYFFAKGYDTTETGTFSVSWTY